MTETNETAARIAPLPNLPLFHQLAGRKAVVVGTSAAAEWKAELLAAAGANVVRVPGWTALDLDGAAIAIADLADADETARFVEAARAAGAVVNVIDKPAFSDVQFGTIVNRAPVVIAISTDGAAPMLGQSIRARIESVVPLGLSGWASAAKGWRARLKERVADFAGRRRFWERFVAAAWREPERSPTDADFEQLMAASAERQGRVIFVTAEPDNPELLTLKAVRALQSATAILYDDGIGADVLELARREAKRVPTGDGTQMIELARGGEIVVRVTIGEATGEIATCEAAGVEIMIIPGVSTAR
jgi:uroporphyrin-III C-methyltransferase/precorrin-2 dehydrogenase/sirohydrochlorin ferrochelatase